MYKMLESDAQESTKTFINIDSINDDVVCEIDRELQESPYDMISMVFLLYDVPDTALQKLIVYQRLCKDTTSTNLNLLFDWTRDAKSRGNTNWKHEFIEALLICQLYGIVKKLGLHVPSVKRHYQPNNIYVIMYINPMKKALYKMCENIESENFLRLKKTICKSYNIDVNEYESCELVLLKLMSAKFITITQFHYDNRSLGFEFNFDKLLRIIEKLPSMDLMASELKDLQHKVNNEPKPGSPVAASSPSTQRDDIQPTEGQQIKPIDFTDEFVLLCNLDDNNLASDRTNRIIKDNYAIKHLKQVGVCLIINQEDFYLSQTSIEDSSLREVLKKRKGSSFDKIALQAAMRAMNFKVIVADNLDHKEMINFIKNTIENNVQDTDSIFMLCLMSHGVKGHVYAADCVKVNIEQIQNLLDSEHAVKLRGMPKILIIQACQIDDEGETRLVADSPNREYYLRKSDFLIYWATAPEYEAYRDEEKGSIFIQILCAAITKWAKIEHLYDIFTKVNNGVMCYSKKHKISQVPIFASTLRKKLYLQIPQENKTV